VVTGAGRTGTDRGAGAVTGTGCNRNPGWQTEDGCGGRTEASNQIRTAVQLGQPAQIETEGGINIVEIGKRVDIDQAGMRGIVVIGLIK